MTKQTPEQYPSIRTPAHPFYKLGVMVEEHGMFEILMALSQYCGAKSQEAMEADDPNLDMIDWVCADHLVSAAAHQCWVLFDAEAQDEAEAAKPTHDSPEQKQ